MRPKSPITALAVATTFVGLVAPFGRADAPPPFELVLRAPSVAGPRPLDAGTAMQHPLRNPEALPPLRPAAGPALVVPAAAAPAAAEPGVVAPAAVAQVLSLPAAQDPPTELRMPAQESPAPPPVIPTAPYPQTTPPSDLSIRPIGALSIDILPPTGRLPTFLDRTESTEGQLGKNEFHRDLIDYSYLWESTAFYCNPLYFEQPNLERYGYHWGIFQPFVSGAQFFVKIPLMPYGLANHHWREPIYSLGYYRPGSYAPYQINWPEARIWPALVEGGFITALVYLIP